MNILPFIVNYGFQPISATGGSVNDYSETIGTRTTQWRSHTFTSVGTSTFTVNDSGSDGFIQCLVIGGGGGAGWRESSTRIGGGGGGGGAPFGQPPIFVTSQSNYSIVVGAGGAGSLNSNPGGNGGNSSAFNRVALGGGGGGGTALDVNVLRGRDGGCGGGGGVRGISRGFGGTGSQGGDGGSGQLASAPADPLSGAGGGASGTPASGTWPSPGIVNTFRDGVTLVEYGAGGYSIVPAANTGGGGRIFASGVDHNGASGIVIIRYPLTRI